jgi:hypothetical protein
MYYEDLMARMIDEQRAGEGGFRWSTVMDSRFIGTVEASVTLALLVPAFRRAGIIAAMVILVLYALFISWHVARGRRDLECGCAGPASGLRMSPRLVYRNLLCASLGGVALLPTVPVPDGPTKGVLSVAVAAFMVASYLCVEQLILNGQNMASRKAVDGTIARLRA